jgi:hypothetical protein
MTKLDDFFRRWTIDAQGARALRGLTAQETCWFEAQQAKNLQSWRGESTAPQAPAREEWTGQ